MCRHRAEGRYRGSGGLLHDKRNGSDPEPSLQVICIGMSSYSTTCSNTVIRHLFELSGDGFLLFSRDGRLLDVNRQVCADLGYDREELLVMGPEEIEPGYDADLLREIRDSVSVGAPIVHRTRYRRKEGSEFPADVKFSLIPGDDDQEDLILAIARDVSDREQMETRLGETVSMLRSTIEATVDGIMVTDLEGNRVINNRNLLEMWHAPQALADLNDRYTDREHVLSQVKNPEKYLERSTQIYSSPEENSYDLLECTDGRIIERWSFPHYMEGKSVGRVWSFRDVTDRMKSEKAHVEMNNLLLAIVEGTSDAISARDLHGNYLMVNTASARFADMLPEDMIGRNVEELIGNSNIPRTYLGYDQEVIRTGKTVTYEQVGRLSGETRTLLITKGPLRDAAGDLMGVVGIARDITERKQREDEIVHALSLLTATFDATADGLLVTDRVGTPLRYNRRFPEMWQIPVEVLDKLSVPEIIDLVMEQIAETDGFAGRIHELFNDPESEGFDVIRFKDGRVFERYSHPQFIQNEYVGRVWSFRDVTQKVRAEEALQESNSLLAAIVESSHGSIFAHDLQRRYLMINAAGAHLFHLTPEELIGHRLTDLTHEAEARTHMERASHVTGTGNTITFEQTVIIGAELRTHLITKSPLRNRDGEIVGVVGIGHDITERKISEERLRNTLSTLAATLDSTADGIMVTDLEGKMLTFNRRLIDMWRIPPEVIEPADGTLLRGFLAAQTRYPKLYAARIEELSSRPDDSSYEVIECLDGRIFERYSQPQRVDGVCVGRVWSFRDVSERVRADAALRDSHNLLNAVIEGTTDAIFARDLQGRYLLANTACGELLGVPHDHLLGKSNREVMKESTARTLLEDDMRVITTGEILTYEQDLDLFSGIHTLHITKGPLRDYAGEIVGIVGIARDISSRKESEAQLHVLSRHLVEAHEVERRRLALELHDGVNQLLSAAKFKVQAAEHKLTIGDQRAQDDMGRARNLLNQAIAEIRAISANLRPSVLDDLGLTTALEAFAREFEERTGIMIQTELAELPRRFLPELEVNIYRMVQEALHNVEKHSCARRATISLAIVGDSLVVRVADDGIGFDWSTVNQKIKREPHFGLVGMRERATFSDGSCLVESDPGAGTRITVTIPVPETHP